MQPASFRGVPFVVEEDGLGGGRRLQLHEYPKRDKPYPEDMGRAAREFSMTGFVLGAEYMTARDNLLTALEDLGPGTLIHPWFGTMQVVCKHYNVTHTKSEGGMARFQFTFIEAGDLVFPSGTANTRAQSRLAADRANGASIADFTRMFQVDGWPDFVGDEALLGVNGALDILDDSLAGTSGVLGNGTSILRGNIGNLLGEPGQLATRVIGLFSAVPSLSGDYARLHSAARALLGGSKRHGRVSAPYTTASRAQAIANQNATSALMRRAQVVQAAGISATMPLPVYDDAIGLRNSITAALDEEALTASDDAFAALADLRLKVHQDMTARARDAARLQSVTPAEVMPSLVLAYDLYEDATREQEIAARNRIVHPGFLPARPLLVLSR